MDTRARTGYSLGSGAVLDPLPLRGSRASLTERLRSSLFWCTVGVVRVQDLRKLNRALFRADQIREDAKLENALTGLGIPGIDVAESTVRRTSPMSSARARAEYRGSWAARREIDRPAADLVREGYDIEDLPEWVDVDAVVSYLSDLGESDVPEDRGVDPALARLYAEASKLGGAALVIVVEDGLPPSEPLDLTRIRKIRSLELLERDEIWPLRTSTWQRIPTHYVIGTSRTRLTPASLIHRSRVILAKGARLSPSEEWYAQGWGASRLEALQSERQAMHVAMAELASAVHRTTIDVAYFADLEEMLADCESRVEVEARIALIARARGQHKLIPMDAGRSGNAEEPGRPSDKFETLGRSIEGLASVAEQLENHWAAGTGQTPSIALGKQAGGLNSGANAGDWQSWTGHIAGEWETWYRPRLEYLLLIVFASQLGPTGGVVPETWTAKPRPLWVPTELEQAQVRTQQAMGDMSYVSMGAISGQAVGEQRFVQGVTGELSLEAIDPLAVAPAPAELPVEGEAPVEDVEETAPAVFSTDPIPGDLMTGRDLAAAITKRFGGEREGGLRVTPHKIHAMARGGALRAFPLLGKVGYSEAEAMRLIGQANGLEP